MAKAYFKDGKCRIVDDAGASIFLDITDDGTNKYIILGNNVAGNEVKVLIKGDIIQEGGGSIVIEDVIQVGTGDIILNGRNTSTPLLASISNLGDKGTLNNVTSSNKSLNQLTVTTNTNLSNGIYVFINDATAGKEADVGIYLASTVSGVGPYVVTLDSNFRELHFEHSSGTLSAQGLLPIQSQVISGYHYYQIPHQEKTWSTRYAGFLIGDYPTAATSVLGNFIQCGASFVNFITSLKSNSDKLDFQIKWALENLNSWMTILRKSSNTPVVSFPKSILIGSSSYDSLYEASGNSDVKNNLPSESSGDADGVIFGGALGAAKVWGGVWNNDYAEAFLGIPSSSQKFGYCYTLNKESFAVPLTNKYQYCIGICSDTAGHVLGVQPKKTNIIIAQTGRVLAYVDKQYNLGTLLVPNNNSVLTKASFIDRLFFRERIKAVYLYKEPASIWGPSKEQRAVDNRHWVKVI